MAEAQARLGNFDRAFVSFHRAVEIAPDSHEAVIGLVDFSLERFKRMSEQLRSSQPGLAAEYRLQALSSPPDRSRIQLLRHAANLDSKARGVWGELAVEEIAGGDDEQGREDIKRALHDNPDDLRAWFAEAVLSAKNGDWAAAYVNLDKIGQHSPGILASSASDWPKSLEPPTSQPPPAAVAGFFQCVRDTAKACLPSRKPASGSVARSANQASASSTLFSQQRWEKLAELPDPGRKDSLSWYRRGVAFAQTSRCEKAIPALELGTKEPSVAVDAMYFLARCYAKVTGRIADSLQLENKDQVLQHVIRGDVLLRLQANSDAAVREYQIASQLQPGDPSVWERLAEAQLGAGQVDAAKSSAAKALQLDAHRVSAIHTLAKVAMEEREYAEALPYLRELAQRTPDDLSTRVELGTACANTGALEEALDNLETALGRGYPDEKGSLHYLLGTVLRKMNRMTQAEQAFQTSQELARRFQEVSHRDQKE
ncbi:MAG: tetratricopeptide repeat protein [Acidobacteriaceae bacterium]